MSKDDEHDHLQTPSGISLQEVRELFFWLKDRMTSTGINEKERKQLNAWLVDRVTDHPNVSHDEFHKIKPELLE